MRPRNDLLDNSRPIVVVGFTSRKWLALKLSGSRGEVGCACVPGTESSRELASFLSLIERFPVERIIQKISEIGLLL